MTADLVQRIEVVHIKGRRLQSARMEVGADLSMRFGATRFGHNLHDPAARMAVLRLKATGLYLNFFYKGKVNTRTERAVLTGQHSQTAEGRVVDGDAIGYVKICQAAGA